MIGKQVKHMEIMMKYYGNQWGNQWGDHWKAKEGT